MTMFLLCICILLWTRSCAEAYTNLLYTLSQYEPDDIMSDIKCGFRDPQHDEAEEKTGLRSTPIDVLAAGYTFATIAPPNGPKVIEDPMIHFRESIRFALFGNVPSSEEGNITTHKKTTQISPLVYNSGMDQLDQYVEGGVMRSERFFDKKAVHLPQGESLLHGHLRLRMSKDFMQTAVNAFAIMIYGTVSDVMRLPPEYVLRSARTISMLKIAREKLVATWELVKNGKETKDVTHITLEMYRPLFKYLNAREIARLNLEDPKIVTYIGTHSELNRHQVGVVASEYIKLNPDWAQARYLNMMNNLVCGVPMTFVRRLPESTLLQLSHQMFYHIRACDPLQRRFFLSMMTKTTALGKSLSWNKQNVARLGLLMTEVDGLDLSVVNPESMAGISAQVMAEMAPENLQYLTEAQLRQLGQKSLTILTRKVQEYQDSMGLHGNSYLARFNSILLHLLALIVFLCRSISFIQ